MRLNKIEKIIFALMLIASVIALFLPDYAPKQKVLKAKYLLYELNRKGRYVTTDELAKALMIKDPSILLIDVRDKEEYDKYTLDGAINIPVDSILNEKYLGYLDQDIYKTILFSNGTSAADEAWMIMKSNGYEGNYVLRGGLNEWFNTIIDPKKPDVTAGLKDREVYEFRRGASLFFTGVSPNGIGGVAKPKAKPKAAAVPVVKRKKKEVSGGCG